MKKLSKAAALFAAFCLVLPNAAFSADFLGESPTYLYVYNSNAEEAVTVNLPQYSPFAKSSAAVQQSGSDSIPDGTQAIEETGNGEVRYRIDARALGAYEEKAAPRLFAASRAKEYNSANVTFTSTTLYTEKTNYKYDCPATRFSQTEHCDVFFADAAAANGYAASNDKKKQVADAVAAEFEKKIHSYVSENVGSYVGNDNEENGKIIVLIEDIKDDYPSKNTYTAGYFSDGENRGTYGGGAAKNIKMVHIDIYPLMFENSALNPEKAYSTLAHEFTHLVEDDITGSKSGFGDYWFKEFFTLSVEGTLYPEENDLNRGSNLTADKGISNGAVLMYKDYATNSNSLSANYGLLYMFGKYINSRTADSDGKSDILKKILEAESSSANAKEAFFKGFKAKDGSAESLDALVEEFFEAFTLCETSGKYSMGAADFTKYIKIPLSYGGSISLKPGAAVVVPLFGESSGLSSANGIIYKEFAPTDAAAPQSIDFMAEKFAYATRYYVDSPHVVADGTAITDRSANSVRHLIFSTEKENLLKVNSCGEYVPVYANFGSFKVVCRSAFDKNVYDTQSVETDASSLTTVNFYEPPEIDWENNVIRDLSPRIMVCSDLTGLKYYVAVYSGSGMLLGYSKSAVQNVANGSYIISNLTTNGLKFKNSDDGEYIIKIISIDNDGITPISKAFKINLIR